MDATYRPRGRGILNAALLDWFLLRAEFIAYMCIVLEVVEVNSYEMNNTAVNLLGTIYRALEALEADFGDIRRRLAESLVLLSHEAVSNSADGYAYCVVDADFVDAAFIPMSMLAATDATSYPLVTAQSRDELRRYSEVYVISRSKYESSQ